MIAREGKEIVTQVRTHSMSRLFDPSGFFSLTDQGSHSPAVRISVVKIRERPDGHHLGKTLNAFRLAISEELGPPRLEEGHTTHTHRTWNAYWPNCMISPSNFSRFLDLKRGT